MYDKLWVVENMRIAFNGGPGVRARDLGTGGTVRNSQIVENGQWGIFAREGNEG